MIELLRILSVSGLFVAVALTSGLSGIVGVNNLLPTGVTGGCRFTPTGLFCAACTRLSTSSPENSNRSRPIRISKDTIPAFENSFIVSSRLVS